MTDMNKIQAAVAQANSAKLLGDKDNSEVTAHRNAYDPKGNSHCFQFGMSPSWWDSANCATLPEFNRNPISLMQGAGAYFQPLLASVASVLPDGRVIESNPKKYNLLRSDRLDVTLQVGVSGAYPVDPHHEVCIVPNDVTISAEDFEGDSAKGIIDFLQAQHPDVEVNSIEVPINDLMTVAGCNCWSDGRVVTMQYQIGEWEPRAGDKHVAYLTIVSPLDGSSVPLYFLTIVRVVCENTMAHARQDGWAKLTGLQQLRQKGPRRTASFTGKKATWHEGFVNVLAGAVQVFETFKKMSVTKIAETRNARDLIIKQFVVDQMDLDINAKTKTGATRAANTLDGVLTKAIYNDDLGGGKNCETLFDLWCGWTAQETHFAQVNGLKDQPKAQAEKRWLNTLTNDLTIKANHSAFQKVLALAS